MGGYQEAEEIHCDQEAAWDEQVDHVEDRSTLQQKLEKKKVSILDYYNGSLGAYYEVVSP